MHKFKMLQASACLPGLSGFQGTKTYAAWPVWAEMLRPSAGPAVETASLQTGNKPQSLPALMTPRDNSKIENKLTFNPALLTRNESCKIGWQA
jgi:hypothetical protein